MTLTHYLNDYFFTSEQLANRCSISVETLEHYVNQNLLPQPAYSVTNNLESCSYFGIEKVSEQVDYFPRGYDKWLEAIDTIPDVTSALAHVYFKKQFCFHLQELINLGLTPEEDFIADIEQHIQRYWENFLSGKYGALCANGYIREIVEVEIVTAILQPFQRNNSLSDIDTSLLKQCTRLLERALSLSCEHEKPYHLRFTLLAKISNLR